MLCPTCPNPSSHWLPFLPQMSKISSLLYATAGLAYALLVEACKIVAPCCCLALDNSNSFARNSLRKKFPQPCSSSFLWRFSTQQTACRKICVPPASPHAKASTLLPLPRQKFELGVLLSLDSLWERLPWNFNPPAKNYANPLGFRTTASCSFSISLFCSSMGSLALLLLFHLQPWYHVKIPKYEFLLQQLMIFLVFVKFLQTNYLRFPTENIKIHTLQPSLNYILWRNKRLSKK